MRRGAVVQGQDRTEGREGKGGREGGRGVSERSHLLKGKREKREREGGKEGRKERKKASTYLPTCVPPPGWSRPG